MTALGDAGETGDSPRLRWLLHQATGDRAHLEEAKGLLDPLFRRRSALDPATAHAVATTKS